MPRDEPSTFLRLGLGMGLYVIVVVLQSTWLRDAELPLWILVPLGWGFLEAYAGFPRPSAFLVIPFLAVNYLGGIVRAKERYL